MSYIKPTDIPSASSEQLAPILLRLLECPKELLSDLSSQCSTAIADLPDDSRPESFEGLLDVARFCVEDEPGWPIEQRAKFIGGHPRIGAPITTNTAELSEESRKEQLKGGQADPATLERLAKLNALYEARYPGLRFVTYVAGRPRAVVADELATLLGPAIAGLDSAADLAADQVKPQGTEEWQSELDRGSDALWEIAVDRAGKLTTEVNSQPVDEATKAKEEGEKQTSAEGPSTVAAATATRAAGGEATSTTPPDPSSQGAAGAESKPAEAIGQDVPFLSLATFRMLVLSSPVLESFFESDLTPSFYLENVEKSQSGGAFAWHTAPSLPGAPRAVPGAASTKEATAPAPEASYSRDVTTGARGKVVGLLGGLLGEEGKAKMNRIADQLGQRLQTHTVSGPKPSFGRKETLDGGRMDTQELREKEAEERRRAAEERKNTLGSRLANALRAPARFGGGGDAAGRAEDDDRGRSSSLGQTSKVNKRLSMRGSDLSAMGPMGAAETLRAAQEALQERPAFVIDEVGANGEGEGDEEDEDAEVDVEEQAREMAGQGPGEDEAEGLLSGKEAQIAKDLRSASPQ